MTYGEPSIASTAQLFRQHKIDKLIVLPLFPQYSATSTAAVFHKLAEALKPCPHIPELTFISDYHDHPLYIKALAESVENYWQQHGSRPEKLLMSFHGIPKRYADQGDPYPQQCQRTAELVAEALNLTRDQWQLCFQSRFGKAEWVKPYTDITLEQWGKEGVSSVDVICPAFAADCLETLEEISEANKALFLDAGGKQYRYIPALNDQPSHIQCLSALVQERIKSQ